MQPHPTQAPGEAAEPGNRKRKAGKKRWRDTHRRLSGWERYRALEDTIKDGRYLEDLADHKVRFAAVIFGSVTAIVAVIATRDGLVAGIPAGFRPWVATVAIGYVAVALGFFVHAAQALWPHPSDRTPVEPIDLDDTPIGVRIQESILGRDIETYLAAWQDVRIDRLNADLAARAYQLAGVNREKYRALRRLYLGLRVVTALTGLLAAMVFLAVQWGKRG